MECVAKFFAWMGFGDFTTKTLRDVCADAGHPDAVPVSSPVAGMTEYRCELCDVYFMVED